MAYSTLKAAIQAVIKQNGNNEITGPILQQALLSMINSLGDGYQFKGVATPATNPGTPDQNVFYIASEVGTYSNFGLSVGENEVAVFLWNGSWSKQSTGAASAEAVNQLGQKVGDLEVKVNGIIDTRHTSNLIDVSKNTDGAFYWINGPTSSPSYSYSDKIPVIPGATYTAQRLNYSNVRVIAQIRMIVGYKADGTLNGAFENVTSYTAPAETAYVIISDTTEYFLRDYAFVENTEVIPYEEYRITAFLKDGTVNSGTIVDKSVSIQKVDFSILVYGKNRLDPEKFHTTKWVNSSGGLDNVTTEYGYYDYLPVSPNTNYHISNANFGPISNRSDCYIAFYDADKIFISSVASNTTDITTPANTAFIRISVVVSQSTDAMMEEGTTRTTYVEYVEPEEKIEPALIVVPKNGVDTENLKDGSVTQDKIAEGVTMPTRKPHFGHFSISQSNLSAGNIVQLDNYIYVSKNISFIAFVKGAIESVFVGTGNGSFYGARIEITAAQIKLYVGTSSTPSSTYNHGLSLGEYTKLQIQKTVSENVGNYANVRLIDDYGNTFNQSVYWPGATGGKPFIRNGNSSTPIDAYMSILLDDINKDIWLFGDSYFNYGDSGRWPMHTISWGYMNYLLNARGGETATEAIIDFENLLTLGTKPSYCVWCLGMNSGGDTNGAVNPTWLAVTQSFITKCEESGIMPILATIPSVPTEIHTKLNEWVRASGYRYIDFAEAVESSTQGDYHWRGWGTDNALLSQDEVHPSQHGAVELASRVLLDFPELMIND